MDSKIEAAPQPRVISDARTNGEEIFLMNRSRIYEWALMLLLPAWFLAGCGRDNGMPRDLISHLAASGIAITPSRTEAPISKRGGYVVTGYDAQIAANIITTFGLKPLTADDPNRVVVAESIGMTVTAKELWGASGRPTQFKLQDGGQFEYFFLLVTPDGEMYLLAEYAYG